MSHDNRARIHIDQPGKPRLYQPHDLPGHETLGVVTQGDFTGALVQNLSTGIYCMANAGAIRSLDQRRIKAALGISNNAGAPVKLQDGKRVNVYLDAESLALAAEIGDGNVSEGIRRALRMAKESK